eukprot:UN12291
MFGNGSYERLLNIQSITLLCYDYLVTFTISALKYIFFEIFVSRLEMYSILQRELE